MKVLVGMSGGIDSSVAAYLLKQMGHEVVAVTMTIWNGKADLPAPKKSNSCFAPEKTEDLQKIKVICEKIGIEHQILDLSELYERVVLKNFQDEYLNGRTPNPCIWCNAKIKFGAMVEYAREKGLQFDKFATGHYARIVEKDGRYGIARAVDLKKDQSYFLYRLNQAQLSTIIFPLGEMLKEDVRKIDVEQGFHDVMQDESQDFYGGDYTDLLDVTNQNGNIVDSKGNILGKHEGIWHYTIGQRKGLGIAAERPLYVLALRPQSNEVVVGFEEEALQRSVTASNIVWGVVDKLEGFQLVQAKIRSTGYPSEAEVHQNEDGSLTAVFSEEIKAATNGQSLVLYDNDIILCGGIIEDAR
ncbi:tRNA 2-thiouridine(34) synthase MnmA [uncultured Sphaerochaeta sp.]|uniref:tRNA 2-thiouridine(34) synthase MnmA n=1 Tax=uncultured Sphaerochaeta sp. TaxID=886478 RepID=UPI002A0A66DB|nr:tRNA 2-thiouridine(34) synthase MnmA [uncultured Sphaerochaeta sp.]